MYGTSLLPPDRRRGFFPLSNAFFQKMKKHHFLFSLSHHFLFPLNPLFPNIKKKHHLLFFQGNTNAIDSHLFDLLEAGQDWDLRRRQKWSKKVPIVRKLKAVKLIGSPISQNFHDLVFEPMPAMNSIVYVAKMWKLFWMRKKVFCVNDTFQHECKNAIWFFTFWL